MHVDKIGHDNNFNYHRISSFIQNFISLPPENIKETLDLKAKASKDKYKRNLKATEDKYYQRHFFFTNKTKLKHLNGY